MISAITGCTETERTDSTTEIIYARFMATSMLRARNECKRKFGFGSGSDDLQEVEVPYRLGGS